MLASTLLSLAGFISLTTAGYVIEDDYEPSSFFGMFDFFTGGDPTGGYVTYVDQGTAQSQGLINTNGPIYMGVDHTNVASGSGRSSVRITSKKSYNHGLIILDVAHMPGGVCGTWPAFWTVGPNWPNSGEIDIIEGVNSQSTNSMTLHTGSGCAITNNGEFTGTLATTNCNIDAPGQATNAGCQINTPSTASFGTGFNADNGGVYATEWTSEAISIWFFSRGAIPSDIASGNPDPTSWGAATAAFAGGCEIDSFFMNQQIVFDTTFCGDWAGNVWATDSVCSSKASTCQAYVQNNPADFADAYWSVNSLKVYQSNGSPAPAAQSGSVVSLSIPATIVSSIPVPVPTSFATSTSAPFFATSQAFSAGGRTHTGHGGHSFTGVNAAAIIETATPTISAIEAPISTDAVVVSSTLSAQEEVPTTEAAVLSSFRISAAPQFAEQTTTPSTTQAAAAVIPTSPPGLAAATNTHPPYVTVSALQFYDFPSEGETQTAGVKAKAKREVHRHLVRHQKRYGWIY